eukprot:COSAG01_NODE_11750_length_1867_cov_3.319570_1_plen_179_part_00
MKDEVPRRGKYRPEQRGCKSAPLSATERACLPESDHRPCIPASLSLGLPHRAPLACLPFSLLDVSTRMIAVDARGAGGKRWSIQGNRACSRPRVHGLHGGRSAHRVGGHRRHLPAFLSPPACLVLCCFASVCLSVCQSVCLPICALTLPHCNLGITDAACACGEVGVGGAVLCGQAVW